MLNNEKGDVLMNKKVKKVIFEVLLSTSIFSCALATPAYASSNPYVAYQDLRGDDNSYFSMRKISATNDGGSILTGYAEQNGEKGIYVLKLDANKNKEWDKIISGGTGESIIETSDNCYALVSHANQVIKLDSKGEILWTKTLKSKELYSIIQDREGNLVVCGDYKCTGDTTDYDLFIGKINLNGDIISSRTYGTYQNDFGSAIQQTVDGGYIMLGSTFYNNSQYIYLLKTDKNGNHLWGKRIGSKDSSGNDLKVTQDNGFVIAAQCNYKGNLIKTDSYGNISWSRSLTNWSLDSVELDTDGYMVIGNTNYDTDNGFDFDIKLVKTDLNGYNKWDYETTEYRSYDYARSITKLKDGSFLSVNDSKKMDKVNSHYPSCYNIINIK